MRQCGVPILENIVVITIYRCFSAWYENTSVKIDKCNLSPAILNSLSFNAAVS
jgi:hypothetical protein